MFDFDSFSYIACQPDVGKCPQLWGNQTRLLSVTPWASHQSELVVGLESQPIIQ